MSKFTRIFAVVLFFAVFPVFPASAQARRTKADLQSMYYESLREEGYQPSIDRDGDVLFKVSGNNYYIIIDENDAQFFRIYTGISISSSLQDALAAANYSNMHSKVAKVYISSSGRSAAINTELLLSDPRDFKSVLSRALSLMSLAERNFLSQLRPSS